MQLSHLLASGADHGTIAAFLDQATHAQRLDALFALSRSEQRALYERVAGAAPMTLDDLVGAPLQPVVHEGKNSLPLFRRFQKVCCRPDDGSARVFGFNEGATRGLIGPGYFVAVASPDAERDLGAVVVDYALVPDTAVADGWPAVVDNSVGLQRFVFRGTRDYLRRVSQHASIGAAWKNGKPFNSWFVLCRAP